MSEERLEQKGELLMRICEFIIQKTSSCSKFLIPKNEETKTLFRSLIKSIEDRYGSVVLGRLVDVSIYIEYANREQRGRFIGFLTMIPKKYNKGSIELYSRRKYGMVKFEDEWLSEHGLSRQYIIDRFTEKNNAVSFSTTFEDVHRKKFFDTVTGFVYCHMRTSGWDPRSAYCNRCSQSDRCKKDLADTYPLLFEQRNNI